MAVLRAPLVLPVVAALLLGCSTPQAAPSPTPTPAPPARTATPTSSALVGFPGGVASATGPVAPGFTRYSGTVVDVDGNPVPNVCVYAGPAAGCPKPSLITDASGKWAFDFPSGLIWPFNFEHPLYTAQTGITGQTIAVRLLPKS